MVQKRTVLQRLNSRA